MVQLQLGDDTKKGKGLNSPLPQLKVLSIALYGGGLAALLLRIEVGNGVEPFRLRKAEGLGLSNAKLCWQNAPVVPSASCLANEASVRQMQQSKQALAKTNTPTRNMIAVITFLPCMNKVK
jgi:hypothetical protein